MAKAVWEGAVLAESVDTVLIERNHYFPPESLNRNFFGRANTQASARGRAQPDTTTSLWTARPIATLPGTIRTQRPRQP